MKLIPVFRLTDRFGIGLTKDKKEKENKGRGCGTIFFSIVLVLCILSVPLYLFKSCINGEETTTEPTTVTVEESSEYAE